MKIAIRMDLDIMKAESIIVMLTKKQEKPLNDFVDDERRFRMN